MFKKLLDRNVPVCLVLLLKYWYGHLRCVCAVRWNNALGNWFSILSGVRQGGILSPVLFSVYIDDLITDLKLSGYGANIGNVFAGCLLYADDIVLLSPTCRGLQKLITACEQYGRLWDLKFNSLKSQVTTFGSKCPTNPIITLLNALLQWADIIKYIVCNTALTDISNHVRQFYSRFINVLSVIGKGSREMWKCVHYILIKFIVWRLRFSSDADIVRLTNARIIIIIIIIINIDIWL